MVIKKVTGRVSDVINESWLKFIASELESIALKFPTVSLVEVTSKLDLITG